MPSYVIRVNHEKSARLNEFCVICNFSNLRTRKNNLSNFQIHLTFFVDFFFRTIISMKLDLEMVYFTQAQLLYMSSLISLISLGNC